MARLTHLASINVSHDTNVSVGVQGNFSRYCKEQICKISEFS